MHFPEQNPNVVGNDPPLFFFGYDPVKNQYKVLAVDRFYFRMEYKVVRLGGEEAWRQVSCIACPHQPHTSGMCMNGTVYYGATRRGDRNSIMVSFDVRLETFNIIKVPRELVPRGYKNMWDRRDKTLINYGGNIGVVENPRKGIFRMWVVEDAEKEEWSMNTFQLPDPAAGLDFKVMDTFSTGEICLLPKELSDPFCLFYYHLEKKSMRSVTIEGLPISELMQAKELSVTVSDHY